MSILSFGKGKTRASGAKTFREEPPEEAAASIVSHHAAIGARPPASRQNGRSGETSNVYRTFSADLSGTTYRGYLFTTTAQPPTAPYMEFT